MVAHASRGGPVDDPRIVLADITDRNPNAFYELDLLCISPFLDQTIEDLKLIQHTILDLRNDPLVSSKKGQAAPRDNVVFEAGYFMHAKGKDRTLIIREEGAKLPADVGGNIYLHLKNRDDISTIHTNLKRFLEERLQFTRHPA